MNAQLFMFMFAMLGSTMGLYALARFMRGRMGIGAGTVSMESLRIVGKRQLDQRKALYVVELGDRYLLVGAAESSVNLVDHISADEFAAMSTPTEAVTPVSLPNARDAFGSLLARARSFNELRADAVARKAAVVDSTGADDRVIEFTTTCQTAVDGESVETAS